MVPRRGAFVAASGMPQEQQLLEARRHVEGVAARLATERITTAEIAGRLRTMHVYCWTHFVVEHRTLLRRRFGTI
jgi:DNA-binding GntR family transcriptional regulator